MASVVGRIREIKQPWGGYIRPSEFDTTIFDDSVILNEKENVHSSIIGLSVDYLTRFLMGADVTDAFKISLLGAEIAEDEFKVKNSIKTASKFAKKIKGIDKKSVINACKLTTFDVWYRNVFAAMKSKGYKDTNPDKATIENIQTFVRRSITFFEKYGPVTKDCFTFEPVNPNKDDYYEMLISNNGSFGGYTATVSQGDGDFLTSDTLWDFKVSKLKPTNKNTLQLLMYWIMGQHSGQEIYKKITKLGIFNPRLNVIYLLDIKKIPKDIIETVEKEVICYK